MSEVKTICMENHSHDGEVLRQELVTYRRLEHNLIREKVERVFFGYGKCSDSFSSTPLAKENV